MKYSRSLVKKIIKLFLIFNLFAFFDSRPGFAQNEEITPLQMMETALNWTKRGDSVRQALFDETPNVSTLSVVSLELARAQENMLDAAKKVNLQVPHIVDAEFKGNKIRQIKSEIDDFTILSASGRWDGGADVARHKSQRLDEHIAHVIDYGPSFFPTYLSLANILFGLQRSAGFADQEIATVLQQQANAVSAWLEVGQHDLVNRFREEFRSQRILRLASERRWLVFEVGTLVYNGRDQLSTASIWLRFEGDGQMVTPDILIHETKNIAYSESVSQSPHDVAIDKLVENSFVFLSNDIESSLAAAFPAVFGDQLTHSGEADWLRDAESSFKKWAESAIVMPISDTIASHVASAETHNSEYETLSYLIKAIENYIRELGIRRSQMLGTDKVTAIVRPSILAKIPEW